MNLPKLIGVIHLPPLPGSPSVSHLPPAKATETALTRAVQEAKILADSGFDGLIIENFGDAPFYKNRVRPETIAALSLVAFQVRQTTNLSLGINVLRNDSFAALSIAASVGANFIRVNVLSGVTATDQGLIEGEAAELLRERARLNASSIKILADVHVKHAKSLSSDNLSLAIEETAGRGGADGIIISGDTTGRPPSSSVMDEADEMTRHLKIPLYLGSGASTELFHTLPQGVRIIVGSTLRKGGKAGASLDRERIKKFMKAYRRS